jgi:uncharacterized secreted protein with C-terminal beta-propeller domain
MHKKLLTSSLSLVAFSILSADSTLTLTTGWNLIGFNKNYTFDEIRKSGVINTTYGYKNSKWNKNSDVSPADGIWAYSPKGGDFTFVTSLTKKSEISKIELQSGWNLVSIPINSTVSPDIFRSQPIVWKFKDGNWQTYRKDGKFETYPQIDILGKGEGFWVFADKNTTIDLSIEESKLNTFSSDEAMRDYLFATVKYNQQDYRFYPTPMMRSAVINEDSNNANEETSSSVSTTANKNSVSDTTSTNLQETGVDESDIVKHDGKTIFYLSGNWDDNKIQVSTFDRILNGETKPLTSISTIGKPNELYLLDNKLIVIYPNNYNVWSLWKSYGDQSWKESSNVEIYDVSNIEKIVKLHDFNISGNIVNSRVVNSKLYLISRFMPSIPISYEKDYESCKIQTVTTSNGNINTAEKIAPNYYYNACYYSDENGTNYQIDYTKPIYGEADLIPTINGKSIISAESLYAPAKIDQSPFITSVISFDLKNSDFNRTAVSVVGNSETIYSSTDAIYIVSSSYPLYYDWENYKERVAIYKFSLTDKLAYRGMGYVDGHILNQFSLSEWSGNLRIATTEGWNLWWNGEKDGTDNIISVLSETNNSLSLTGEVRGLGKANESIRGVRFFGDRGYITTFLQKDPLYVVDLSNPAKPKLGENPLEINGYSSYFHQVNAHTILSLGMNANDEGRETGYQLSLFDFSDINNPKVLDKKLIPEIQFVDTRWLHYSDAFNDHKAFTYRNSDHLFAIPFKQTIIQDMNESAKEEWKNINYFKLTLANYKEYGFGEKEKTKLENNESLYIPIYYAELCKNDQNVVNETNASVSSEDSINRSCYYISVISEFEMSYQQTYSYKNSLEVFGIEDKLTSISEKSVVNGGSDEKYNYQRGLIFSTGSGETKKDWAVLLSGGEFYINQIK